MKYSLAVLILIFCFNITNAQQKDKDLISIVFEDQLRINVLKQIENKTSYQFYYIDEWFGNELVSGRYENTTIDEFLEKFLEETSINYYVGSDSKVYLTQSVLISDTLPKNFFNAENKNQSTNLLTEEINTISQPENQEQSGIETIRIGKERKNSNETHFTLEGFIKYPSGTPISNVAVIIEGKNINAVTNSAGYYSFKLPKGINILSTKTIGFVEVRKKIVIYNNGSLNIELQESLELLNEVNIDVKGNRNVSDLQTGVSQITIAEMKTVPIVLGERNIFKVATTLPGIITSGEGSAGFNVRGGKEDQNLILLDNGVIYNPTHFFGIFSAINPFTTETANIYKGTVPIHMGGRLSSVFDITTKDANTSEFKGEGSIGAITGNLMLDIPIIKNKSGLIVGGRAAYSNWILKTLKESSLKNSKASFYDGIAKYHHAIDDKNQIQTTVYFSNDEFSISSDTLFNYKNQLATINWKHRFNNKINSELILTNSNYSYNISYDNNTNTDFNLGYRVNETEVLLLLNQFLTEKHKLNYGISSKLYINHPGNKNPKGNESIVAPINLPKEKGLESAIFISDNFDINQKLAFNLGLRLTTFSSLGEASKKLYTPNIPKTESSVIDTIHYKNNEIINTYIGPEIRASLRYSLNETSSIKSSYNSSYQYIHTLSNTTTLSPTDTWKLSDINIKPQSAQQFSLGYYKNMDGNNYEISLETYYKISKNILDYKVGANLLINESIESEIVQGNGKSYGIEFLLKKNRGKLNGWLSYTYSRSLIQFESDFKEETINNGDYFPSNFDKPHVLDIVANYKLTKRYSLSANFSFQSGKPVTLPIGKYSFGNENRVLYSERNKYRIPNYYRLDLGVNIEGNHKIKKLAHSFWNISVYNVLGRNNPYSVFFVTQEGEIKAYKSSIFSVPIPTITYNFKF